MTFERVARATANIFMIGRVADIMFIFLGMEACRLIMLFGGGFRGIMS